VTNNLGYCDTELFTDVNSFISQAPERRKIIFLRVLHEDFLSQEEKKKNILYFFPFFTKFLRSCIMFVNFFSSFNRLEPCSDHFSGWLCLSGGITKDPIAWLDGARPPP